jgi:hypothetical protein
MRKLVHAFGTDISGCTSLQEALVASELNYKIGVKPVLIDINGIPTLIKDSNVAYKIDENGKETVFKHKGKSFGTVGSGYTPIQNDKMFEFMDKIVDSKNINYYSAGSIMDGSRMFISGEFTNITNDLNDPITLHLVGIASHDATQSASFFITPKRVACTNAILDGKKDALVSIKLKHTKNYEERFSQKIQILHEAKEYSGRIIEFSKYLKSIKLEKNSDEELRIFMALALGLAKDIKEIEDMKTRGSNILDQATNFLFDGVGQDTIEKGTAYWAMNGVTTYFHNHKYTDSKIETYVKKDIFENEGNKLAKKSIELMEQLGMATI